MADQTLQFGDWRVEPDLNRLVKGAEQVVLEPRTMAVLQHLLAHPGKVVTLDELLDSVWQGRVVELSSVQRHMARLRHALDDDPKAPRYIETIKKTGYRTIAPVEVVAQATQTEKASEQAGHAIAVLPFENLSPNEEDAFFAAGIHEELITRLAKLRSLKVISRTSVMEYADRRANVRSIAAELGVDHVLEGTVRRAKDQLRINVQLIDAQTDQHLWAEVYDRALTARDVFAIQGQIALAVVASLRGTLSPREAATLDDVPTHNTRAYDFYLIGNEYFRYPDARKTLPLALQMYEQATARDPEFALAHAALSHVHSRMFWVGLDRTQTRLTSARDSFERAFALSPDLPEAHLAAGQYYYRGYDDYARALQAYDMAETNMPSDAKLAMARAEVYRRAGQWDLSRAYWQQAIDLDPRNPLPLFQHATTSICNREYDLGEQYAQLGFAMRPDEGHFLVNVPLLRDGATRSMSKGQWLSWLQGLYERDYDAQLAYLDRWVSDAHVSMFYYLPRASLFALTYELKGQHDKAEVCYRRALSQVQKALEANVEDAMLQIALGEALAGLDQQQQACYAADRALELRPTAKDAFIGPGVHLDAIIRVFLRAGANARAISELDAYLAHPGAWSIEGLLPDPRLDGIRDDPEFQALVAKYRR